MIDQRGGGGGGQFTNAGVPAAARLRAGHTREEDLQLRVQQRHVFTPEDLRHSKRKFTLQDASSEHVTRIQRQETFGSFTQGQRKWRCSGHFWFGSFM